MPRRDVAGMHPAPADDAGAVAGPLFPDGLPVADVGPAEAGRDDGAAVGLLRHRAVEADSRRVEEGVAEPQGAGVGPALVDRTLDGFERLGSVAGDLAEDDDLPGGGDAGRGGGGAGEGVPVGDQVVGGDDGDGRERVAARGEGDGGERVAAFRLEGELDPDADLAGLLGDEVARGGGADQDRGGEELGREPLAGALERRGAAVDRDVLPGMVAAGQGPGPRARAAAEDDRDRADPRRSG
ncbi:MAG: hypothetical protein U1E40_16565 [Amaricoccus sp.]